MSDLINRKSALKALRPIMRKSDYFYEMLKAIQDIPSAQSERKKGKWIIKGNPKTGWYSITCPECGEDVTSTAPCIGFYPNVKVTWDYCPNCGTDMRGKE